MSSMIVRSRTCFEIKNDVLDWEYDLICYVKLSLHCFNPEKSVNKIEKQKVNLLEVGQLVKIIHEIEWHPNRSIPV